MEASKPPEANMNSSTSIMRSKSAERRWVLFISEILEKELKAKTTISCSVFAVPKFLSAGKPEDYTPQFLALGPYHHFSQDLYDMERYKLVVAKQMHHRFQSMDFNAFVARLSELELDIRACYHRRLDVDGDTLALVMAIDGLFLLELLCSQVRTHDLLRPLNDLTSDYGLVLPRGKRLTNDALLRDIMKLENQIPFFVLSEILAIECSNNNSSEMVHNLFPSVLVGFCKEISPLNLKNDQEYCSNMAHVIEHAHILDLLYHMILPEKVECSDVQKEPIQISSIFRRSPNSLKVVWNVILNCVEILKNFKKIFQLIERSMKQLPLVGGLVSSMEKYSWSGDDRNRIEVSIEDKTPLMEAGIMVPTASELFDAGVTFKPTASIETTKFDAKTVTFFLPVIRLGVNSEVILRNLVAYEAMVMADCQLVFTRYLHLMNCLIDRAEDVRILKDEKIVVSGMKKDQEIADLFNGLMNNSIELSHAKELDEAINGVNAYYEGTAKVKAKKMLKKYIYGSWRILTLFATLMLLGLLVLQTFCSVYSCHHLFRTIETAGEEDE